MKLDKLLRVAVRGGASDVVLKTGSVPRFRFNGELISLSDGIVITPEIMNEWIASIVPRHLESRLQNLEDLDFSYQIADGFRFRVNLFRQRQLFGLVLRVVSNHIRTLEELQLPKIISKFADEKRGIILVTGATGSGKSTTLAGMIQKINLERSAHIVTVEDPIEFNFRDEKATIHQREIGVDSPSFGAALRSALRQNPDVILVGELRDHETVETALMAAETGHLVLSTLHTLDAVESLTRIMSYFSGHQALSIRMMLAATLKAIISQRLLPRADNQGMVPAFEIMVCNAMVRDIILQGKDFSGIHEAIREGRDNYGMQSFDQSLIELYKRGAISKKQAVAFATHKDDVMLALSGIVA